MWHDEFSYSPTETLLGRYALFSPMVVCCNQDKKQKTTSGYSPGGQEGEISTGLGDAYLPNVGKATPFPGERVAPLTGQQTDALDLSGFTDIFRAFQDSPLYSEGGAALRNVLSGEGGVPQRTPGVAEQFVAGGQAGPSGYAQEYAQRPEYTPGATDRYLQAPSPTGGFAQEYAESYNPQRSAQPQTPITEESAARMFENIFTKPAQKRYTQDVAPATREEFAGPGYWSGARAGAAREDMQDLQDYLGTKGGEFEREIYDRNFQRAGFNAQLDRDADALASSRAGLSAQNQRALEADRFNRANIDLSREGLRESTAANRANLSAQLGRDETALAQSRAGLDVTLSQQRAQEERDRQAGVFGAVDRTSDYLSTPGRLSQQALQGRAGVFDFARAEQQQAQNVINSEMQKYAEQYNITDPQTLSVLSMLLNMRYGTTTTRNIDRASDYDEFMGYAQPAALFMGGPSTQAGLTAFGTAGA